MLKECVFNKTCSSATTDICTSSCIRYIQFNRLLELSNLPESYYKPIKLNDTYITDNDKEMFDKLNSIDMLEFVKEGKNLFICSNGCGNGKTTWAIKLMQRYFYKSWQNSYDITRGIFVKVTKLLNDMRNFEDIPEYTTRVKDADLVIFDDLGSDRLTDFGHEQLIQIIDYRLDHNLSNIYTSNITKSEDLITKIGARLTSRTFNSSKVITFDSRDYRSIQKGIL